MSAAQHLKAQVRRDLTAGTSHFMLKDCRSPETVLGPKKTCRLFGGWKLLAMEDGGEKS